MFILDFRKELLPMSRGIHPRGTQQNDRQNQVSQGSLLRKPQGFDDGVIGRASENDQTDPIMSVLGSSSPEEYDK